MTRPPLSHRIRLAAKQRLPARLWARLKAAKDALRPPEQPPPPPEWEYVPEGWARGAAGWDVAAIAEAYRAKWPSFLAATRGPGPLGVNHEVPAGVEVPREERDAQHVVLAFGYALALAARGKERVSLLDWGGGPGHYAVLAQALVPGLELDYHARDLPALAALGRELQPELAFHDDDAPLDRRYDLVVASSALQYAEDWRGALERLAAATDEYLYVTRVPVALWSEPFVVLQRAYAYGYGTEYLGWVLNRDELVAAAGLELVREFVLPALLPVAGAPETPVQHRGFLFRR